MEELISVIVPVYNVEQYLHECIDSILAQTYSNFELILVDDGSTDNSGKICDDYANRDNRVKVVHQENGGLGKARNVALAIAKGNYIAIVDSDDWIEKDMLEGMYLPMKASGADILVAGHFIVHLDNSVEKILHTNEARLIDRIEATSLILEDKVMHSFTWDKMYKKELFEGILYTEEYLIEDIFTTYKLADKSKNVLFYNKAFYYYRRRESGMCLSTDDVGVFRRKMSYYQAFYQRYQFASSRTEYAHLINHCQEKAFDQGQQFLHYIVKNKLDKRSASFFLILQNLISMDISNNPLISNLRKWEHRIMKFSTSLYIMLLQFYALKK